MTTRTINQRAADLDLVSEAILASLKAALPALVRREVSAQMLTRGDALDEPSQTPPGNLPGSSGTATNARGAWPTLPRPKS